MNKVRPNNGNEAKSDISSWYMLKSDIISFFIKKFQSVSMAFKIKISQFYY